MFLLISVQKDQIIKLQYACSTLTQLSANATWDATCRSKSYKFMGLWTTLIALISFTQTSFHFLWLILWLMFVISQKNYFDRFNLNEGCSISIFKICMKDYPNSHTLRQIWKSIPALKLYLVLMQISSFLNSFKQSASIQVWKK